MIIFNSKTEFSIFLDNFLDFSSIISKIYREFIYMFLNLLNYFNFNYLFVDNNIYEKIPLK